MKPRLYAALALLAFAWTSAASAEAYALQVAGMSCQLCAYSVKQRLGEIDGVQEVRVNLEDGEVIVRTRDGTVLTEAQARKAIEGAGFKLDGYRELSREPPS